MPEFLAKLDGYQGDTHTVRGLRLLMLTATRSGEVWGAMWSEFNLDAALWIIPAERMKMKMEHRVPLSRQGQRGYGTSSEYIRELIRKDHDRMHLRKLLLEGAGSKAAAPADDAYFEALRDRVRSGKNPKARR